MTQPRPVTLLELAIAASAAIVPVLLMVLLIVAEVRPSDPSAGAQGNGDRHVSVRQVAALKTFERAVVRRDQIRTPLPSADAVLEGVPQCRPEWDGRGSPLQRFRQWLAKSRTAQLSPAQRLAAQLEELDVALVRFSTGANRRVTDAVGFDASRWFTALQATLQTAVETPDYPGRRFTVHCADIASAVGMLSRGDGRMLATLAWRGTVVERTLATWRPEQYVDISARQIARRNPWSGLPGCVYIGNSTPHGDAALPTYFVTGTRRADGELCSHPAMYGLSVDPQTKAPEPIVGEANEEIPVDDPRWSVPPSLSAMLQPLATLQRPTGALYRMYTDVQPMTSTPPTVYRFGPNKIDVHGSPVDVGFSIDVTIDPAVQALAQRIAACYTGRQDVCRSLRLQRKEDAAQAIGHRMLEHAVVRMAAVAIIDVATGRIEALAGALSPCTRQEYDGPGRAVHCEKRLPYPIRYRPDALLNPAVFHDAMPASVIKPIMAVAFLSDPIVGARWLGIERADLARAATPALDSLRGQLMRSNSARFLDRMFCADQGFINCRRPWEVQSAALAFGWNRGCAEAADDCGKRDLLFGSTVDPSNESGVVTPLALRVPYGRLLVEPLGNKVGAPVRLRTATQLDAAKVQQCAAGADGKRLTGDDWEKCRGGGVVDIIAEGWGQGQARSTALGVAGMMAALAAAANGQTATEKPHLVHAVRGVGPADATRLESAVLRRNLAAAEPNKIAPDAAAIILSGLTYSHRAGTARLACEQVFDASACRDFDWIAGKTGTPTFPNDGRSLDEIARLCAGTPAKGHGDHSACGPLRPYKWYTAAYRTDRNDTRWTKVIGVLTERNWIADTGRIHGAGDLGPNPAAEIALQIVARHAGYLSGDSK
jgi:cell division protein FtsI/penicillin-binding protein 2